MKSRPNANTAMDAQDEEPPSCPSCGSTHFHVLAGLTFCANGHDQHRGPLTAAAAAPGTGDAGGGEGADGEGGLVDDDDWNRRGGKVHRVRVERRERVRRVRRGREAAELWVRGMGWCVWRGCWAVGGLLWGGAEGEEGREGGEDVGGEEGREEKGKRDELWGVVKGLWALRVGELVQRWDAEQTEFPVEDTDATDTEVSTEAEGNDEEETKAEMRKRHVYLRHAPKLLDTVVLQYIALLLIRYPVSLSSVYDWVQTEALPYIRAIRHIPIEIKGRLPPEYHFSFDMVSLLQREDLQLAVLRNAKHYTTNFGLSLPALNWRPLLLDWIEKLALPLQVYAMVKQLNAICSFEFAYDVGRDMRRSAVSFPEAQLMALLVVSTKLLFPFDAATVRRYARATTEQGLIRVDWDRWLEAKEWFDAKLLQGSEANITRGREMEIKDVDIMAMDDQRVDDYMDWYQGMWMSQRVEEDAEGVQRELLGMFSLQQKQPRNEIAEARRRQIIQKRLKEERLARLLGGLKSRQAVTDEQAAEIQVQSETVMRTVLRPGMAYQVFSSVNDLDGPAKVFHQEAAETACLDLKGLLRAVNMVETHIDKWRRDQKREAFFADDAMDLDQGSELAEAIT
jgi:RNA polymerase I-specific transcription initiation factor RRN7